MVLALSPHFEDFYWADRWGVNIIVYQTIKNGVIMRQKVATEILKKYF